MSNDHNIALIRKLQTSWHGDSDPADFASCFTPDGVFEDMTYKIHVEGREALEAHARRMHKYTHDFIGNFDGVDCTGRPVNIHGLSLYHFRDGHIAHAQDFWNYMEIVRTMEVIPKEIRGFRTA